MHKFIESKVVFRGTLVDTTAYHYELACGNKIAPTTKIQFPDKLDLSDFFAGVEERTDLSKQVPATSGVSWGITVPKKDGPQFLSGEPRRWLIDWCKRELVTFPVSFELIVGHSWPHNWCALYVRYESIIGSRLLAMVRPVVRAGTRAELRFGRAI